MNRLNYQHVQAAVPRSGQAPVSAVMVALMLRNVSQAGYLFTTDPYPDGEAVAVSAAGCVLASPSYPGEPPYIDQSYVFHWTRDAAIAAIEMAHNPVPLEPDGSSRHLCDYVTFSQTCQTSAISGNVFYRACYQIDGAVRAWSDQKDGPALQNLAFIQALPLLTAAAGAVAQTVAQTNLDHIVADWSSTAGTYNPWEEVMGDSFFATSVQLRCLREVATTNQLNLTVDAAALTAAIAGLTGALEAHWDPARNLYVSVRNGVLPDDSLQTNLDGYDPNIDIVIACIYGSILCTDPQLLATAAKVRATFDTGGPSAYPINAQDEARSLGPMIGRYPSDVYDGDVSQDRANHARDHPWALCTAHFAELYFRVARQFDNGAPVPYGPLTGPFFDQIGLDEATVNDATKAATVAATVRAAGDRMLQAIIFHSDHYRLSEQFDAETGFEKSVDDLTWSYAAYLSAVRAR